jgi:hypothetical protein
LYQFTRSLIELANDYREISLLPTSCNIFWNILFSILHTLMKLLGIALVGLNITEQPMIRFPIFVRY